jgi:ligand-binding SRPBCC domain-containing protein
VTLEFEHVFGVPVERLFAFHMTPGNLALLQRGWPTFRMVAHDGHIRVGSVTRVQERIGFVWVPLTFEHFLYEPPYRFGEHQVRGPFAKFEHVHEFVPTESGTLLRDVLDVRLPWYLGDELAMKLFVAPKLQNFFAYRHVELERFIRAGVLERMTA